MTTQVRAKTLDRTGCLAHVEAATSTWGTMSGTITTAELDSVDQRQLSDMGEVPDSEIDSGADVPNVQLQQMPVAPARPQLRLTNPDCPIRYIPIHVW